MIPRLLRPNPALKSALSQTSPTLLLRPFTRPLRLGQAATYATQRQSAERAHLGPSNPVRADTQLMM